MSISLTTYVTMRPGEELPPVTTLSPSDRPAPLSRLVVLFGIQSTVKVLGEANLKARAEGRRLYRIDMKMEAGEFSSARMGVDELPKIKVLNLRRIKLELAGLILQAIGERAGGDPALLVSLNPALVDKLVADPRFEHLDAVIWRDGDRSDAPQYAAVRPEALTDIVIRGMSGKPEIRFER